MGHPTCNRIGMLCSVAHCEPMAAELIELMFQDSGHVQNKILSVFITSMITVFEFQVDEKKPRHAIFPECDIPCLTGIVPNLGSFGTAKTR